MGCDAGGAGWQIWTVLVPSASRDTGAPCASTEMLETTAPCSMGLSAVTSPFYVCLTLDASVRLPAPRRLRSLATRQLTTAPPAFQHAPPHDSRQVHVASLIVGSPPLQYDFNELQLLQKKCFHSARLPFPEPALRMVPTQSGSCTLHRPAHQPSRARNRPFFWRRTIIWNGAGTERCALHAIIRRGEHLPSLTARTHPPTPTKARSDGATRSRTRTSSAPCPSKAAALAGLAVSGRRETHLSTESAHMRGLY